MEDTGANHLSISKATIYDEECKVGDPHLPKSWFEKIKLFKQSFNRRFYNTKNCATKNYFVVS